MSHCSGDTGCELGVFCPDLNGRIQLMLVGFYDACDSSPDIDNEVVEWAQEIAALVRTYDVLAEIKNHGGLTEYVRRNE